MVRIGIMRDVHDSLASVDLNLVLALDALLAERHVTRAAERLGLTQSAASHALARLRDVLGDPLLVRGPRGAMVATPLAEKLAPQIHRILGELATTLRGETFEPATAKRAFHIGISDYVEIVMLKQLAARVAVLAPGIDLWMHTFPDWGDTELADGTLDLIIGPPRGNQRPAGTFEKVLFDESFTCVLRAGHALAGARLTIARYCSLPHLMVSPRGTPGSFVDTALERVGRTRRVALAVPHFLVVPYVIAGTDLIATLPTRIANLVADALELVKRPPPIEIPKFQIAAAWHERNQADAPHRWLRDQIFAVAGEIR
jgi:DNA-binding transcriptional LysR family regulator